MSSDAPRQRFTWMQLAWWHEQDARVKRWFADFDRDERTWPEHEKTRALMLLCHAVGWPCLLTPVVTRWLYPWLPQPDAGLFYFWGATSFGGALLAHMRLSESEGEPPGPMCAADSQDS